MQTGRDGSGKMKKLILEKIIWIIGAWSAFLKGFDLFAMIISAYAILAFIALAVNNFMIATLLVILGYVFFLAGILSQRNVLQHMDRKKNLMKESCKHIHFSSSVYVNRIVEKEDDQDAKSFSICVKINCADCREPFVFMGLPFGYSEWQPSMSPDRIEARLPIAPKTEFEILSAPAKYQA